MKPEGGHTPAEDRHKYPVYVPQIPRTWWLRSGPFRRFAARELTSAFAAAFSLILLAFLVALSRGPDSYRSFLRLLDTPGAVAVFAVILAALVYHALTWFRLTSHILVVRLGHVVVPRPAMVAGLIVVWIGVSALVAYFHLWF